MSADIKKYSGIDLLDKIFEFIAMTPDSKEWNVTSLKSNPPRLIRFRQIEALLKAFFGNEPKQNLFNKAKSLFIDEKKMSIQSFMKGDFIRKRTMAEYAGLSTYIQDFIKLEMNDLQQKKEVRIEGLAFIFPQLVEFRKQVRSLLAFNSGWAAVSSITSQFSISLTSSISNNLTGRYDKLDEVLEQFINPTGIQFTREELIAKFDFPTECLGGIDMGYI
nr:hypothetical protein [uncultured Mucilaginibacter sp.]